MFGSNRRQGDWDSEIGSSRAPPLITRDIVYVVVCIHRTEVRPASLVDQQTDVEILGVFTTRRSANEYIEARDPMHHQFSHYMIHEAAMNPGVGPEAGFRNTFRSEIYS